MGKGARSSCLPLYAVPVWFLDTDSQWRCPQRKGLRTSMNLFSVLFSQETNKQTNKQIKTSKNSNPIVSSAWPRGGLPLLPSMSYILVRPQGTAVREMESQQLQFSLRTSFFYFSLLGLRQLQELGLRGLAHSTPPCSPWEHCR